MAKYNKWLRVLTKEFLIEQHHKQLKSPSKIANEVGCDHKTVIGYLDYWGVKQLRDLFPNRKRSNHPRWCGYKDISSTYWRNLLNGARVRNIEFKITIQQAWQVFEKQNGRCALTGQIIGFEGHKNNSASLDRIDSKKPYTVKNVQWVHKDINFAKQSMSNGEFIELCQLVITHVS